MGKPILKFSALITLCLLILSCNSKNRTTESRNDLFNQVKSNFENPEVNSGVNCWWWWLNGNVNKAAITKDLEAMKSRNFHGAMIFDAGGHDHLEYPCCPAGYARRHQRSWLRGNYGISWLPGLW